MSLDIIGRPDPLAWYNALPPAEPFAAAAVRTPPKLRVGVVVTPPVDLPVDQACLDAVEATAKLLESLGHAVEQFDLGIDDVDRFVSAFGAIWNTGMAGVPLVAGAWQEATLLQLGTQLEAAQPWIDRQPVLD